MIVVFNFSNNIRIIFNSNDIIDMKELNCKALKKLTIHSVHARQEVYYNKY